MNNTIRRWGHPRYRHAHQHELPDLITLAYWIACACLLLCLFYIGYAYSMVNAALDAEAQRQRVLSACNTGAPLGVYREKDGSSWSVHCNIYERKVKT